MVKKKLLISLIFVFCKQFCSGHFFLLIYSYILICAIMLSIHQPKQLALAGILRFLSNIIF